MRIIRTTRSLNKSKTTSVFRIRKINIYEDRINRPKLMTSPKERVNMSEKTI